MAKIVKVVRVGDSPKEIGVTEDMRVTELLNAAGYQGHSGKIFGQTADGTQEEVKGDSEVNGYDIFVLTNNVKGGRH